MVDRPTLPSPSHTPGPWQLSRALRNNARHDWYGYTTDWRVYGPNGQPVISARGIARPTSQNGEANARLIAAAPDLLAELVILVRDMPRIDPSLVDKPAMIRSRAAIAKATGQ